MKNRIALLVFVALVSRSLSAQGNSQRPDKVSGTSITVVMKENFPQEHIAAIVRRNPGAHGDFIIAIARADAQPELLWATLTAVAKYRLDTTHTDKLTLVFPRAIKYPPLKPADKVRMNAAISQLRAASPRAVPAVGRVQAISVEPPPVCTTCGKFF